MKAISVINIKYSTMLRAEQKNIKITL